MITPAVAVPYCYRFKPSDEELINGYLLTKAMHQPLPWNGILERNIYGKNNAPWEVFGDIIDDPNSFYCHTDKDNDSRKTIYVFTKLVKVGPKSKRISRTAGCGTWSGQTGAKKITSLITGEVIGSTKMFQFEPDSTFGHWIMHEYSLDGVSLTANSIVDSDLVLCKITRMLKKSENVNGDYQEGAISVSVPAVPSVSTYNDQIITTETSTSLPRNKKRMAGEDLIGDDQLAKKQRSLSSSPSSDFSELDQLLANLDDEPTPSSVNECDDHQLILRSPNDDINNLNLDQIFVEGEYFDIEDFLSDVPLPDLVEDSDQSQSKQNN